MMRAITTAAVAALLVTAVLSVDQTAVEPSSAGTAAAGNLRLIHKQEDTFRNYDFDFHGGPPRVARNDVDWPIDLVFYNGVIDLDRVKNGLSDEYLSHTGDPMHGRLSDAPGSWFWDEDKGKKTIKCPALGDSAFHYRIYATPADSMMNLKWGFYAIASAHIDHNECSFIGKWSGKSEDAEAFVAQAAARRWGAAAVHRNKHYFWNPEPYRKEGGHIWLNDGRATFIRVPGRP